MILIILLNHVKLERKYGNAEELYFKGELEKIIVFIKVIWEVFFKSFFHLRIENVVKNAYLTHLNLKRAFQEFLFY